MSESLSRPPKADHQFRRVAILFAGGPAPGANAVISTAATSFMRSGTEVVGMKHGYSSLADFSAEKPLEQGRDYWHGLNELMGSQHRILMDFPSGAGFVGIAVALMGRNHPAGIVVAAVLFGALYQGGSQLSFDMPKINRDMVVVIQGLVILLCGAMENVFRAPLTALFARVRSGKGIE
jgi:hypothetical protein